MRTVFWTETEVVVEKYWRSTVEVLVEVLIEKNRKEEIRTQYITKTKNLSNNGDFWNLLKQMKRSNFDKRFHDQALSPIQDLSKHYK